MAIATGIAVKAVVAGATTATTPTGSNSTASGSTFVVGVNWYKGGGETFTGVTDSKSNSYTIIGSGITHTALDVESRVYYCENGTGGTDHTFTATCNNATAISIFVVEITGGATSGILDKNAGQYDAATAFTSGATATTTQAAELLVGFIGANDTWQTPETYTLTSGTPNSGWTLRAYDLANTTTQVQSGGLATAVVASTGAYTFGYTSVGTSAGNVMIATFKEGSSQSNAPRAAHQMKLMGAM